MQVKARVRLSFVIHCNYYNNHNYLFHYKQIQVQFTHTYTACRHSQFVTFPRSFPKVFATHLLL